MNTLTQYFSSENEMLAFAGKLAKQVSFGTILFLCGHLGAGKTTFTRGFLRGMGHKDKVKSPTYALVEPYEIKGKHIFHFDFYRLDDVRAWHEMGIEEYFSSSAICIIEWPEKWLQLLPEPDLACYIDFKEVGRQVVLQAKSVKGREAIESVQRTVFRIDG